MRRSLIRIVCLTILAVGPIANVKPSFGQMSLGRTAQAEEYTKMAWTLHERVEYDSSILLYQKAAGIFTAEEQWEKIVHCLNYIALCYSRKMFLDSMETSLLRARQLELEKLDSSNLECAETFSLLGLLYMSEDKFELSIRNLEEGMRIREERLGRDDDAVASSHCLFGTLFYRKGEYNKALMHCIEALRIYTLNNSNDHYNLALSLTMIGSIYGARSEFDVALGYYLRASSTICQEDKKYLHIFSYCEDQMAWAFFEKGDYPRTIEHLMNVISLNKKEQAPDRLSYSDPYFKLGQVFEARGDYDRAIEFYQKVLALDRRYLGDSHTFIGTIDRRLSSTYAAKGDLESGLYFAKQALDIHRRALGKDHPELGFTFETLGNIYLQKGEYELALSNFLSGLEIRLRVQGSPARNDIANLYCEIGRVYTEMKSYDLALDYYLKSLAMHDSLPEQNRPQRGATLKGLGDLLAQQEQFDKALDFYQESIDVLQPSLSDSAGHPNPTPNNITYAKDLLDVLGAKAAALEKNWSLRSHDVADLKKALATYEDAARTNRQLRRSLSAEGSKLCLQERSYTLHQRAIQVSLKLFDLTHDTRYKEAAFAFSEDGKANILLDGLIDSEAEHFGTIPDSITERERSIRTDLTYYSTKLQKKLDKKDLRDSSETADLRSKCFSLNTSLQDLLTHIENTYPQFYELKHKCDPPSVSDIQRSLDSNTCIIEYSLSDTAITIFTLSRTSFDACNFATPPDFRLTASTYSRSIKTVERDDYLRSSASLYDVLLRHIEGKLSGKQRIVIIPDGILYYVPFEALISDNPTRVSDRIDLTKLEYFVKFHEIVYSYSTAFYLNRLRQRTTTSHSNEGFAGFAPVFRDKDGNGRVLVDNTRKLEYDSSAFRSLTLDGKNFTELKYSEQEVTSIAKSFKTSGKPAIAFLRSSATEENFKRNLGSHSCLHIATHAYINEKYPQLSMLLFSQPVDTAAPEDGILYASETYDLNMNVDLLVLSSCESGLGKFVNGEGMMAMTRGFFYSGARNIIFSLWKVFDKQTSDLMFRFYHHVLNGESFSSSLRKAKLNMIANPSTAFPSKWSGFILVGT